MKGSMVVLPQTTQLNSQDSGNLMSNEQPDSILAKTKPIHRHTVEKRPQMSMWDLMVLYDSNKKRMEDVEARNLVK